MSKKQADRAMGEIRATIACCGHAFFAAAKVRAAALNALLDLAEANGLHVERFMNADRERFVWITDQTKGPVPAVPAWAAFRGWED